MSDSRSPISPELEELLSGFLDDSLTPDQSRRLAELIQTDPEARALYLDHCRMHATLAWEHGVLGGISFSEGEDTTTTLELSFFERWGRPLALVASLLLIVSLLWVSAVPALRKYAWESGEVIGTVLRKSGAAFSIESIDRQLDQGDKLRAGTYLLEEGLVQMLLDNGVEVLVEAPAEFNLKSSILIALTSGRLSANVPPQGIGFTVETPTAEIVDFGTEFGVEVGSDNQSEVHVFNGIVEVKSQNSTEEPVRLVSDQATRVDTVAGDPIGITVAPDRFLRSFNEPTRPYSRQIRDLDPVAYYRMPISDDGLALLDKSGNDHHGRIKPGKIKRSMFASGRLGASLRLNGPKGEAYGIIDDYPKAENNQLSVVAWVFADARPRWASIAKNWYYNEVGQFHFGLFHDEGTLEVQIRQRDGSTISVQENEALPIGSWQHVAFVADGEFLRLYRNGEETAKAPYESLAIPTFSSLGIGAKLHDKLIKKDTGTRGYWDGRIDELAIFNHALSGQNIRQLYASIHLVEIAHTLP